MEFSQLIQQRHSVRAFSDQPVTQAQLETIVTEASQTASWVNSQPWKVYVATGQTLEAIRADHQRLIAEGVKSNPVFPVQSRADFHPDQQANMAAWSQHLEAEEGLDINEFWQLNRELFRAPAIMYFALPKSSPRWSVLDMGAFLQTASLSANNLGLGTMVAYELIKFPDVLAEHLAVDPGYELVIGMAMGYAADHPINAFYSPRQPLAQLLTIKDEINPIA